MKGNKKIKIIIDNVIVGNKLDLNLLSKIVEKKLLERKELKKLLRQLKYNIKKLSVRIEYAGYISKETSEEILKKLDKPTVFEFIENKKLIGGIKLKEDWNIIDSSINYKLQKIQAII